MAGGPTPNRVQALELERIRQRHGRPRLEPGLLAGELRIHLTKPAGPDIVLTMDPSGKVTDVEHAQPVDA